MGDDIKQICEGAVAFVPAETKGLLFIRVKGDWASQDALDAFHSYFHEQRIEGNLKCGVAIICEYEGQETTMQMLTDDQLRDIGFERIKPKQDLTDITRSFG